MAKKKPAPKLIPSKKTAYQKQKDQTRSYQHRVVAAARDIAPLPTDQMDWELRLSCKHDFIRFCKHYLTATFYLEWSQDQIKCAKKGERICIEGGKFAVAMPRGGGKTAICRALILWATIYGHIRYPFFIGSKDEKAIQTLEAVKANLYRNQMLLRDFPEVAYPILKIENRFHMARGQLYEGQNTEIRWGAGEVRYPSIILPDDLAELYWNHDETFLRRVEGVGYICRSAGTVISTAGIDGSIRGSNEAHPITLEEVRPDLVLADDLQKDQKAENPASVEKLINLFKGAVIGLGGPDMNVSILMPGTVIRENDFMDQFLDTTINPEYSGERCRLVESWPDGITDFEITKDTPAGEHWNEYGVISDKSFRLYSDNRLATDYYKEHQAIMDENFVITWPQRLDKRSAISAQQHAMNLRLGNPATFPPEYQNIGRPLDAGSVTLITAEILKRKVVNIHRGTIPIDATILGSMIDVQDEMLYWGTLAVSNDFTGVYTDYGTWPDHKSLMFTREQANSWNMISKLFFNKYPQYMENAIRNKSGRVKAPLQAKIYYALTECHAYLRDKRYVRTDEHGTEMPIGDIAIDARWGEVNDTVKRFIRELGDSHTHAYYGNSVPPTHNQFSEYTRTPGWLFEDQRNPLVENVMWIRKIGKDGEYYMAADVDLGKDFLFGRLATAPGLPGSISLFQGPPETHSMFAHQICNSEYPEEVVARGLKKNKWVEREGRISNEFLDIAVGCIIMCSYQGACLSTGKRVRKSKAKRSLAAVYERKRKITKSEDLEPRTRRER